MPRTENLKIKCIIYSTDTFIKCVMFLIISKALIAAWYRM